MYGERKWDDSPKLYSRHGYVPTQKVQAPSFLSPTEPLSSSLGNGAVAGSYRYDSWQLQFWDPFLFFESIDIVIPTFKRRIFMTIAGSYILQSWQLQLVLTVEFCIELWFLRRYLDTDLSSRTIQPWRPLLCLAPPAPRWWVTLIPWRTRIPNMHAGRMAT